MSNKVVKFCRVCGRRIVMGYTGIWNGRHPQCDQCAGVKRDSGDIAFTPNEQTHGIDVMTVDGERFHLPFVPKDGAQ